MIIDSNVVLKNLIIHGIDNSGLEISQNPVDVADEGLNGILIKYFFSSFKDDSRFSFKHSTSLDLNEVFTFVSEIFDQPQTFEENSARLTKHLQGCSSHHNIKPGDLFVAYFEDCVLDDEIVDAVGIFKAENKDTYLKVYPSGGSRNINSDEGISINKLDKGAIVFNTEKENGYVVVTTDSVNKDNARYWLDDFLNVAPIENEYYNTQGLINLCQEFVQEAIPPDEKAEQISILNDSMKYLKSSETFDNNEFKEKVLQQPELIDAFENFREKAIEEERITPDEQFDISNQAVKKTKRFIRSVIKLDKNFHVYVHGNREHIQKGFDQNKQKSFYTLYFDEES